MVSSDSKVSRAGDKFSRFSRGKDKEPKIYQEQPKIQNTEKDPKALTLKSRGQVPLLPPPPPLHVDGYVDNLGFNCQLRYIVGNMKA